MFARLWPPVAACLGLALVVPRPAAAQVVVVPGTATTWQPVVETRLRAEPALTLGTEPRIGYRPEAQLTTAPVTTFHNVTVDEGHYQTVWVPRPVVRPIARTTWQPQISYRSVPYVYAEPVAQWTTRLVGEQSVRYVPQTQLVGIARNVSPCVALPAAAPAPVAAAGSWPMSTGALAGAPIPDPAFARSGAEMSRPQWTMVSPRAGEGTISPAASLSSERRYEVLPAQALTPGESVKAPSAAIVWQTPGARP